MKARTNRLKRNNISDNDDSTLCPEKSKPNTMYPVSYTHLTLPTNREV